MRAPRAPCRGKGRAARGRFPTQTSRQSLKTAIDLDIADLGALAKALGREDRFGKGAQFGFQGRIGGARGAAAITGALQIGATAFETQLSVSVKDDTPAATGTLHTKLLHPESLTLVKSATSMLSGIRPGAIHLDQKAASGAHLTLDTSAGSIAGSVGRASDVIAHLELSKTALRIDPFDLHYLGGRVEGSLGAQIGQAPPPLDIKARVRSLGLAALFGAFGQPAAATGPLDMDLAVRGAGRTAGASRFALRVGRRVDPWWLGVQPHGQPCGSEHHLLGFRPRSGR